MVVTTETDVLGERVIDEVGEDRAATFDAFASRHLDAAYRVATAILGDPAAAQDATHDAFVAAWRGWPSREMPRGSMPGSAGSSSTPAGTRSPVPTDHRRRRQRGARSPERRR